MSAAGPRPDSGRVARRADLSRIAVVGTTSAGKSTLAARLARVLGVPHLELDELHWGPGWTRRPEFVGEVLASVQTERWVIDGNYRAVRDAVWRRATSIVWLDYSLPRVFGQALYRTARRVVTGTPVSGGNRETIGNQLFDRDGVLWWVLRTHGRRRREFPELFERSEYRHAQVVRLGKPSDAEAFLAGVHTAASGGDRG